MVIVVIKGSFLLFLRYREGLLTYQYKKGAGYLSFLSFKDVAPALSFCFKKFLDILVQVDIVLLGKVLKSMS